MDVHMIHYLKNYLIVRKGRINMHTNVNDLAVSLEAFLKTQTCLLSLTSN